jgi:hypothetical protein
MKDFNLPFYDAMRVGENLLRRRLIHSNLKDVRSRHAALHVTFDFDVVSGRWVFSTLNRFVKDEDNGRWRLWFRVSYLDSEQGKPESHAVYRLSVVRQDLDADRVEFKEVPVTDKMIQGLYWIQSHCDGRSKREIMERLKDIHVV